MVYEKIVKHWKVLLEFLEDIIYRHASKFSPSTVADAETLLSFLRNKFALALLHFYLDNLDILATESKVFQKSGSTIITQRASKYRLQQGFMRLKTHDGFFFKKFLLSCSCHNDLAEAQKFIDGKIAM